MKTTENKEVVMKEEIQDPRQYIYTEGTKVEVEGYLITDLIMIFDQLLKEEIKVDSKFKYNYVNQKGNIVKNAKPEDLESGKVNKIVDFQRTVLDPSFDYSITEKGIAYAELKNFLEKLHNDNIKLGKAVNYKDLSAKPMVDAVTE